MNNFTDGLFTSDWHLRDVPPSFRKDDPHWIETQLGYVSQLVNKANDYKCPLFIAGDIFDRWYGTKELGKGLISNLIKLLLNVDKGVYFIAGQHDMCNRSLDYSDTAMGILESIFTHIRCGVGIVDGFDYGTEVNAPRTQVIMIHRLIYKYEPYPNSPSNGNLTNLVKEFPDYKYIIAGDNHIGFYEIINNVHIINCGSLYRKNKDQIDYKPRAYYVNSVLNIVEEFPIDISNDVISVDVVDDTPIMHFTEIEQDNFKNTSFKDVLMHNLIPYNDDIKQLAITIYNKQLTGE